jgi:hypothetical protein
VDASRGRRAPSARCLAGTRALGTAGLGTVQGTARAASPRPMAARPGHPAAGPPSTGLVHPCRGRTAAVGGVHRHAAASEAVGTPSHAARRAHMCSLARGPRPMARRVNA